MLSKPDVEVVYDAEGVVTGVKSNNEKGEPETAVTKLVVGDPSALGSASYIVCAVLFTLPHGAGKQPHSFPCLMPEMCAKHPTDYSKCYIIQPGPSCHVHHCLHYHVMGQRGIFSHGILLVM